MAGDGNVAKDGELAELMADTVHEHDLDAEAAEDGDVDEEIVKILVGDDGPVDRDDENLALKTRDVFEDAAQIVGLDRGGLGRGGGRGDRGGRGSRERGALAVGHERGGDLRRSGAARQFTCRVQVRDDVSPTNVTL